MLPLVHLCEATHAWEMQMLNWIKPVLGGCVGCDNVNMVLFRGKIQRCYKYPPTLSEYEVMLLPMGHFRETMVYPHTTQYEHHYIPTVLWEREIVMCRVPLKYGVPYLYLILIVNTYFFCRWNFYSSNAGIVSFDKYYRINIAISFTRTHSSQLFTNLWCSI